MFKSVLVIAGLLLSGLGFADGHDYPDYPDPKPNPRYSCIYDVEIEASKIFKRRSAAKQFCYKLGEEFCTVEQVDKKWEAVFFVEAELAAHSDVSAKDARSKLYVAVAEFIEDNKLFRDEFTLTSSFNCVD